MIYHWLTENIVGVLSIIIGTFIAYHVFFLSKRMSNKTRLEHKERVKQVADLEFNPELHHPLKT